MNAEYVVFLPGLLCDHRLFSAQTIDLDVPHHVASLTGSDSIEGLARQVLAEAPARFAVVGLSMGGIIAFELWRTAAKRISHLLLLDTTPHADPPDRQATRLDQIAKAAAGGLRELAAESLKPVYLGAAQRENPVLLDCLLDMAVSLGPDVFESQSLALRNRPGSENTLGTITVPTHVVCGAEDVLCPPAVHQYMAQRIPGAALTVLDDCGHMATMEQPAPVNRILKQLLFEESEQQRTTTS
ncbi:MAG: alpha/beta fold hydrolase [Pseudomonadota bacterium]